MINSCFVVIVCYQLEFQQPAAVYGVDSGPLSVISGDFNKDGHLDLAVTCNHQNTINILFGTGNGSFQLPAISFSSSGIHPYWMVAADFNVDGNLDLAVTNEGSDNVAIFLGQSNGSFQLPGTTFKL